MPFPLPIDPQFRREIIKEWLYDVDERLAAGTIDGAEKSWKDAAKLYLGLGAGEYCPEIDALIAEQRVKIDQTHLT